MFPSRQSSTAVSTATSSPSPRRTGNAPPDRAIQPSGNQKSSDFAMKRRKRRGKRGIPSGQGSKFDQWFAARTNPPSLGRFSTPDARSRKSALTKGQLSTAISE